MAGDAGAGTRGEHRLRVVLDARLKDGVSGGVQQWVIGLASALTGLDDGPEDYMFLTTEGEDDWLRPYVRGRGRLLAISAPPPPPRSVSTEPVPGSMPSAAPRDQARRPLARRVPVLRSVYRHLRRLLAPRPSPTGMQLSPTPEPPPAGHLAIIDAGADVMHFTNQSGFRTSIASIYQPWDLQHMHLPEFFTPGQIAGRERRYRAWCEQASRVIVATTWVKDDLAGLYGIEPERIVVVNPPPVTLAYVTPTPEVESAIAARLGLPEAFLLYPAQTWAHKNHDRLFEALSVLKPRGLEIDLVCSGTQTERYEGLIDLAARLGIGRQVRFLGYRSPAEVQVLYRRARGLVFPSLYEGWGLPILEAFAAGLPVATSNATSLPALVADAAIVFDPLDAPAIADAVERLWTDEPTRRALIERGRDRVRQFDWETTARLVRAVYRDVAGRPLDARDRALLAARPLV